MAKMVKQETNPNRNHIYIIEEYSDDPEIPVQSKYRKIGVLQETTMNECVFWGRTRALRQGNVRDLRVVRSIVVHTKAIAEEIEKRIHNRLIADGYRSRYEVTKGTGHGEWFDVPLDVALLIFDEEEERYSSNRELYSNFFKEDIRPVPSHRPKKTLAPEFEMIDIFG